MPELAVVLLVVVALVLLNGLFVAAEFAIIGTSRAAMAARAAEGDALASRIARILEQPVLLDRYVATAQLGITFASLGLGMYGEHKLAMFIEGWLLAAGFEGFGAWLGAHGMAVVLAIAGMTYLHIVLGEMVPKSLALTRPMQTALWVTRPMLAIGVVLTPLVRVLNWIGNTLLGFVGFRRDRGAAFLGSDELESVARESQAVGLLDEESGRVFLELADFSELTAAEAMVPRVRVAGLQVGADAEALREGLLANRHTRYPVYDGNLDAILGTVHIKDLLALLRSRGALDAGHVRPAAFVPETATLDDVLEAMRETRNQMVVVMDEHGGTAGILTMEDLCAEAVGDIEEGSDDVPDVTELAAGRFQVQGTLRLDTLGVRLGRALAHEEVDTVSGLILDELGRPPEVGDAIDWSGLRFQVSRLHGHGVASAIVSVAPATDPPGRAPPGSIDSGTGRNGD
jgi:CBS domain containing-hemolysin-like protein